MTLKDTSAQFRLKRHFTASAFLKSYWPPLTAFVLMTALVCVNPFYDLNHKVITPAEQLSLYLGHAVNSIWIGMSLFALILPALPSQAPQAIQLWAWRAFDAILVDFLVVDGILRRFVPLGRPGHPLQPGFPSGHALYGFLISWLIWNRFPCLGPFWFLMAGLVGWSRVEVHAHYPYQVIIGAMMGCALGWLIMHRRDGVLLPRIFLFNRAATATWLP
jgi:membrane-associated phospholipid phosphatase